MTHCTWALGSFSTAGCSPFPALVLDDHALALRAFEDIADETGQPICGADTMAGVLDHWQSNAPVIDSLARRLRSGELAPLRAACTPVSQLRVHAPIPAPRQIFCTGANYRSHVLQLAFDVNDSLGAGETPEERRAISARKMDERAANGLPYAFIKLPSAVTGPYDDIVLPAGIDKPDWELELVVVIGRRARHVKRDQALQYVAGYTVGNDISARDRLYRPDLRTIGTDWLSCKSPPTFLPLGPCIVPATQVPQPQALRMRLSLNGQVMQDASTDEMIFDIARQIEYLSARVTLFPGDLVMTGSPAGNGSHYKRFLQPGDVMVGTIDGIGEIRNHCIAEVPL